MRIPRAPHCWSVTPRQAIGIQRRLAALVRLEPPRGPIRLVAGVDAAFSVDGAWCLAAAVVWNVEALAVVEERAATRPLRFPYVPGLLSFREAPAVIAALRALRTTPDAIMCDAHGLAHPRRFGLACHVGVICGLPTLGCAKSKLIGKHGSVGGRRGARCAVIGVDGAVIGSVLRTRAGVKPVYVSVGHLIDLPTAERVVLDCAVRYRLPEPTRLADQFVGRLKRSAG